MLNLYIVPSLFQICTVLLKCVSWDYYRTTLLIQRNFIFFSYFSIHILRSTPLLVYDQQCSSISTAWDFYYTSHPDLHHYWIDSHSSCSMIPLVYCFFSATASLHWDQVSLEYTHLILMEVIIFRIFITSILLMPLRYVCSKWNLVLLNFE